MPITGVLPFDVDLYLCFGALCPASGECLSLGLAVQVAEHGSLQDAVAGIGKQTTALDAQYRMLTRERQKYRLNAAVNASMSDMQAQQVAIMR